MTSVCHKDENNLWRIILFSCSCFLESLSLFFQSTIGIVDYPLIPIANNQVHGTASSLSSSSRNVALFWNLKVHKIRTLYSILDKLNPVNNYNASFSKIHFNIIIAFWASFSKWLSLSEHSVVCFIYPPCVLYVRSISLTPTLLMNRINYEAIANNMVSKTV